MLVRLTFSNWMSFRDETTFDLIASLERQHGDRIPRVKKFRTKVLPVAALFGGNASGKSNLIEGLQFAKDLILRGTRPDKPIPVKPFKLDPQCRGLPTKFKFELLLEEDIYDYELAVTWKEVLEEQLVKNKSTSETVLYCRKGEQIEFDQSLEKQDFLKYVANGTRSNELFLTNAISQRVELFRPVHAWFSESLILAGPRESLSLPYNSIKGSVPLNVQLSSMLPRLDTSISRLGAKEVALEDAGYSKSLAQSIKEDLNEGETYWLGPGTMFSAFSVQNGKSIGTVLQSYHKNLAGEEVQFEMEEEADGTKRLIELLPALLALAEKSSKKTFVIDEIDRSLHSLLTLRLLQAFLSTCSENSRSQLLFTTHDLLVMDQRILRRDEMWLAERDQGGNSRLTSLREFKDTRSDKDIRKSYVQGRMGGIPNSLWAGEDLLTEPESGWAS